MLPHKKLALPIARNVALCYIRLSYSCDDRDKDSPERQRANIQLEYERRGWIPEWYQDAEGHKSGQYERNRPGWLALKARLGDPDVVAIVANDLARPHRKGWRVGGLIDFAMEHDVRLVMAAPGRNIDLSGPMGRMSVMIAALMDEYYAVDISRRAKDSIAHRKRLGKVINILSVYTVALTVTWSLHGTAHGGCLMVASWLERLTNHPMTARSGPLTTTVRSEPLNSMLRIGVAWS